MPVQFARARVYGGGQDITARLEIEDSERSGGGAVLEEIERPKRTPLTEWVGGSVRRQTLSLLLEGHVSKRGLDADIRALEVMSEPPGAHKPPPRVKWDTGGLLEHDATRAGHLWWWVEELAWDNTDRLIDRQSRETRRQRVSVRLVQVVEEIPKSVAKRKKNEGVAIPDFTGGAFGRVPTPGGRYTVKSGDTLRRIAERELGDSDRWREIKALNPQITNTKNIPAGSSIRLPAKK